MEITEVKKVLHDRYIKPTINNNNRFIGVEIELPILNLNKLPVDFKKIHIITKNFINKYKFDVLGIDDDGNIYSAINKQTGDILSFDCSYNNLELSFGKETNLLEIQKRFNEYYRYIQQQFKVYNYTLTGMGINPYRIYNNNVPIPNERYRMLFHHLNSRKKYYSLPMYFHKYPEYGTFSSASQVQIDVSISELPDVINVFSKLEPIKAILFSNSILIDEHEDILCYRDIFWENSPHGINKHNIGMYDCEFENVEEILSYISTTSIYCVERNKKYINFAPMIITDYLNKKEVTGEYYNNGHYENITITPQISDIQYLRTFKFEDLTFRGTIEFRSVCCQPIKDSMTVSAFHLGIKEKLSEIKEILINDNILYNNGYNAEELRKMLIQSKLPNFINKDKLYSLIKNILDLSYKGLKNRKLGEEVLLDPLYDRVTERTNPAQKLLTLKSKGVSIEEIISLYSQS